MKNIKDNKIAGTLVFKKTFKEGEIICHKNNWDAGMYLFFKASDDDVKNYSNKNGLYVVLTNNNNL